jgi:hypothetical protein
MTRYLVVKETTFDDSGKSKNFKYYFLEIIGETPCGYTTPEIYSINLRDRSRQYKDKKIVRWSKKTKKILNDLNEYSIFKYTHITEHSEHSLNFNAFIITK